MCHSHLQQLLFHTSRTGKESSLDHCENESVSTDFDTVSTVYDEFKPSEDSEFHQSIAQFFQNSSNVVLPITAKKLAIVNQIRLNRVTIIVGSTGCGKTTQVPQFIMDDCFRRGQNFNIVVTQPRRIAAMSVAKRVCHEREWKVGELVGYQIGMEKVADESLTRLLYCTTGVLLNKLVVAKKMDNYSHIIIDEVHERSEDSDVLLMMIRKFMWTQATSVKLVIMSATLEARKFQKYFSLCNVIGKEIKPTLLEVTERTQKLSIYYINSLYSLLSLNTSSRNWNLYDFDNPYISREAYNISVNLIKHFDEIEAEDVYRTSVRKGAVLVFLPGYDDINEMLKLLLTDKRSSSFWLILPLHSTITLEEQRKIFEPAKPGERKIVLATNIAESSITLPDIEYVIDFCLCKSLICDPETNYPLLHLEWATKSSLDQRAGRAGRVKDGRVYRMITREFESKLLDHPIPEILRSPLELSILKVKRLDFGPPKELLALCLDPPNLDDIKRSILKLKRVGAITSKLGEVYNEEDGDLTVMGNIMSHLPLDVHLSKFIILGYLLDVLQDTVIMAACITLHNLFSKPFNKQIQAYKSKLAWSDRTFSDLMAYWNAYKMFQSFNNAQAFRGAGQIQKWCHNNFIQARKLKEVDYLVNDINLRLKFLNIVQPPRPNVNVNSMENELIIKVAMCGAFYPNYFLRHSLCNADTVNRELNLRDPCSTVRLDRLPYPEGVLYVNQLYSMFSECSEKMEIEFEQSHAYITFSSEDNLLEQAQENQRFHMTAQEIIEAEEKLKLRDTSVKTSVYVAIKMRQLRLPLMLNKIREEIVSAEVAKLNALSHQKNPQINNANHYLVLAPNAGQSIKTIELPLIDKKIFQIFVTHVVNCGHFWAQYATEQSRGYLNELEHFLALGNKETYCHPKEGDLIIAPKRQITDLHTTYGRARVTQVHCLKKYIKIFYIDYGHTEIFKLDEISKCYTISSQNAGIYSIPALAFECKLSHIQAPEYRNYDLNYSKEAMDFFHKLVDGCIDLWAKVHNVVNKVAHVELFRQNDDGVSINTLLLRKGYAEKKEAQPDAAMRSSSLSLSSTSHSDTNFLPTFSQDTNILELEGGVFKNLREYSRETIKLNGPYTPLETRLTKVTRKDLPCVVEVESDSVNSVGLEPEYNSFARLLVAANIGVSSSCGKLIARGTTLMPRIKGFFETMLMLFAPTVELRVDKEFTHYTGALCGLGYDDKTNQSFDPDHDISTIFSVVFSPIDIGLINMCRLHINDILSTHEKFSEYTGKSLQRKQEKLRECIFKLLRTKRFDQIVSENIHEKYQWGLFPQDEKSTQATCYELDYPPILSFIRVLKDIEPNTWKNSIKLNLETVKEMIDKYMFDIVFLIHSNQTNIFLPFLATYLPVLAASCVPRTFSFETNLSNTLLLILMFPKWPKCLILKSALVLNLKMSFAESTMILATLNQQHTLFCYFTLILFCFSIFF